MHKCYLILSILPLLAQAQETLDTIEVKEEKVDSFSGFWEENKDARIYSGKKNTVTNLKEIPALQTNNYRLATSQTPGLLISEVPNESLAAITSRGLGDPHESYNVLLLQDGLPVASDMYGYPAHYYSPALPMMEKVQFIRGGASLLYGPQPGGVLNYHSTPLRKNQATSGKVGLTGGSYNLLSTNNALYGSKGDHAYGLEYFRRQGHGPQRENSDFAADYVQLRNHTFKGKNKYKVSFNGYNSDHGNPGGFALIEGADLNTFGDDQGKATRKYDRLKVRRAQLALGVEHRLDDASELHMTVWGNAYDRYSKSQNTAGSSFGRLPNGSTNTITLQRYYGYNAEARYLRNYSIGENESTFSAGLLHFNLLSPLTQETGNSPGANHGTITRRVDRSTHTNSLFVENRFSLGRFMVTPGVRLENIRQEIDVRRNGTGAKLDEDSTANVPLFGLGAAYHVTDESQVYFNVSEAYKPVSFQEAVVTGNNVTTVSDDIDPSRIVTYEFGNRGQTDKLNWDASLFFIRYENKFGQAGTQFQNTGAGHSKGIDLATELKFGDFNVYANVEYLEARYTRSAGGANVDLKGKTPQYAPKTTSRLGIIHGREDRYKVALMGVIVDRHFGDDANSRNFKIPSYTVFDLTGDVHLTKSWVASLGINNLFDREYYSRVRADGVAWALGRNAYAGVSYRF